MNLFIVIVLYKCKLSDSESYITLRRIFPSLSNVKCLLVDNSPIDFVQEQIPSDVIYLRQDNNPGLAFAYNKALELAYSNDIQWLLLLDQDSSIKEDLFVEFSKVCNQQTKIALIVPNIETPNGVKISPLNKNHNSCSDFGFNKELFCINSFSIINVRFAKYVMNGFNEEFPLDMLDYYTCHFINNSRYYYYVLPCVMKHNLSVSNADYVNSIRYESIVKAELRFFIISGEKNKYICRLLYRSIKFIRMRRLDCICVNLKYIKHALFS